MALSRRARRKSPNLSRTIPPIQLYASTLAQRVKLSCVTRDARRKHMRRRERVSNGTRDILRTRTHIHTTYCIIHTFYACACVCVCNIVKLFPSPMLYLAAHVKHHAHRKQPQYSPIGANKTRTFFLGTSPPNRPHKYYIVCVCVCVGNIKIRMSAAAVGCLCLKCCA